MRKVILLMHVSLDGFVQGQNDWEMDWITYDEELEKYSKDILSTVDTVLWGRGTYLGMQQYWTSVPSNPSATNHEIDHSHWLENTTKIVFSKSLDQVEWKNSRIVKENIAEEISILKQQTGKDMIIIGSPRFAHTLMQLGLIDEYRINVNPVVIGGGLPLFKDISDRINLKLVGNKTFNSGVVGLVYQSDKQSLT
jgi:dihydrofolate reductase